MQMIPSLMTRESSLEKAIITMYRERHGDVLGQDIAYSRVLSGKGDSPYFIVFIMKGNLDSAQTTPTFRTVRNQDECRMCFSSEGIVYRDSLVLTADLIPFFGYHTLARPVKQNACIDSITNDGNYKRGFVEKEKIDCRKLPTEKDIQACVELAHDTNFTVLCGMEGTGGGVPEHIHYQAYMTTGKDAYEFPLLRRRDLQPLTKSERLQVLYTDTAGFSVTFMGDRTRFAPVIISFYEEFQIPLNFALTENSGQIQAILVPRVREVPRLPRFADGDSLWKFGFGEIFGSFPARTLEQYQNLVYDEIYEALEQATVEDKSLKEDMKKWLVRIVQ